MGAQWKQKGRMQSADAKGRLFSKLAKEIIISAKAGADPTGNARLRMAIDAAKKQSMPRDTLDRAIKKGSGQLDGNVQYETVLYEGYGPHQVPIIVECLTDNKNRTAPNMRVLFRKGQLGSSGSVSWDFDHVGAIEAAPPNAEVDAEEAAILAGAQDVAPSEEGQFRFVTEATDLDAVSKALALEGWDVSVSQLEWVAKNPVQLEGEAREEVESFLSAIDDDDDVQSIYVGLG